MWVTWRVGRAFGRGASRGGCRWVAGCAGRRGSLDEGVCAGRVWAFWRGGKARVAGPVAVHVGGRVWATGSGAGGEGRGVWGWVRVRCVSVSLRLQRCVCVVSCRLGNFEEELAVFRVGGEDLADACAYLVHLSVSRGKRVLQGGAKAHAPEDPVDSVVLAGEGVCVRLLYYSALHQAGCGKRENLISVYT